MSIKYLTKSLFERNATNGLDLHDTLKEATDAAGCDLGAGAVDVRIFECVEIEFEHFTATRVIPKD